MDSCRCSAIHISQNHVFCDGLALITAIAGEYEEHFGKVTMKMLFSTPYEKNEKVIIMIGIVTVNEDGTQTVAWTAYEGVGVEIVNASVEEQGCIQVELDPEIVLAIQEGITLLAVVSK